MKEGEEEKILLSSLGVTSANVEDVERKFLSEAREDPNLKDTSEGQEPGEELDESSKAQKKLQNNLHAVQLEIEAVASGLDKGKSVNSNNEERKGEGKEDSDEGKIGSSKSLQKALVTDRLKSLEKVKSQIKRKLSEFGEGPSKREKSKEKELIQSLVKEKPKKNKGIMKTEVKNSGTTTKKRVKIVSISEDTEFDAILDAASSGFMETEREKLVRKGILTPFHSLRGFERRVQTTTRTRIDTDSPSARQNAVMNEEDLAEQESIARLTRSMAEIVRSRPTTKLMDPDQLPRLDPPTAPFLRMRAGSKGPASGREDEIWGERVKRRRPLPDKKWRKEKLVEGPSDETSADSDAEEYEPDIVLEGGLNIPSKIYNQLFDYQKIGVQWLWELHCQKAGGIIGDEMGLGKTIQVLSFLASLHHSRLYQPSIIVCPVTLLRQWEREAETWYPHFHVEILHDSAYVQPLKKKTKNSDDEDSDSDDDADYEEENENEKKRGFKRNPKKWDELIKRVVDSDSGLLITTYEQLRILGEKLLDVNWGYAILDEGHRIRNPNAEVTLICKQFRTLHRVIMTGAPIQNKLAELWSLFDFVFPGKLGVLPVFEAEFSVPITVGGYVNANPLQVSTAYRCAVVLRDLIMPYLLRRMKADVDAQLPNKTEHVLFCSLLPEQRAIYRNFLASSDVEQIFDGRKSSFGGIDVMKKICNHPDLLERESSERNPDYGNINRSGKLKVVEQIFRVWKEQGHRVLLFAQTQQMLDIIEDFLVSEEYIYRRMDGKTPVKQRMALIDEFNNSSEIFVFILTTKVGGLGTNLTGANRIIIYDPDWNPSTDMQARERAWRIGQKKDVTVYRLITRGTIEEKIYQRQIYKHFLTNKVLKDARQKRLFTQKDMKDLYTLQDDVGTTETSNIFGQLSEDVNIGVQNAKDGISNGESSDQGGEEPVKENGETNILKSLFNAHGIHSAMNHDAIMNVNEDQKVRMEKEANQVAQRAAEALRQSRRNRVREDFAVPTWTGLSGSAGAPPGARGRFGSAVPRARPICPEASRSRAPMMTALPVGGVGVNNRRALSSSDVLHRIRGTHSSAVSDAMETDSLPPARLVSPEASRSGRLLTAVPVGGSTSSDTSSEASRRRVALTALPVGARSANRVDSDSSLGASRSRFATAVPVGHGANRRMTGGAHASAGRSRSRVITQPEVLIRKICTFLQEKGGSASSVSITQYFQDMVRPEDANLFKSLLKEIATLKKGANGSKWFLKSGYEN